MPTFTALPALTGKAQAEALGDAMERLNPEPTGVGVFEVEDGSGLWEVGAYFTQVPDDTALMLLATAPFLHRVVCPPTAAGATVDVCGLLRFLC